MTDVFDRASELEAQQREAALEEARYRRRLEQSRPSAEECRVCGERIPLARRKAVPGVQTCVHCQAELEGALL